MHTTCRMRCYWGKLSLWKQAKGRFGVDVAAPQRLRYGDYALSLDEPEHQQEETRWLLRLEVSKVEECQWPAERRRCAGGSN